MTDEANMREEFEEFGLGKLYIKRHSKLDYYVDNNAQLAWITWKAATEQSQQRIAELEDQLAAANEKLTKQQDDIDFWKNSSRDWRLAYIAIGGTATHQSGAEELAAIKAAEYRRGMVDGDRLYAKPFPAQKPLSDTKLSEIAVFEEFLLYCSQDEFNEISRAIEAAHGITENE